MTRKNPLLVAGIVAGPLFVIVAFVQVLTREGFDLTRQAISMLSLGDQGWIQIVNFELTGLLAIICAVGLRVTLRTGQGSVWAPLLFGGYGLGLVLAGIFHPDPGLGFPPGAPSGMPASMSGHAVVHQIAFFVSFLSLIAACFVFGRRFAGLGRRPWAIYSFATGVAPVLMVGLSAAMGGSGVPLFVMGVITSAWVAIISADTFKKEQRV